MPALKVANPPVVTEPAQPRVVVTAAPIQVNPAECPQRKGMNQHRGPFLRDGSCPLCGWTTRTMRTTRP